MSSSPRALGHLALGHLTLGHLALACLALTSVGCLGDTFGKTRRLHYIGDRLVSSEPVPPYAYEAYLRARLALDRNPQDLAAARTHIDEALRWDPEEPQLWTTRAEIAWLAGDFPTAEASVARALELRPGYPAATQMQAQIRSRSEQPATAAVPTTPATR